MESVAPPERAGGDCRRRHQEHPHRADGRCRRRHQERRRAHPPPAAEAPGRNVLTDQRPLLPGHAREIPQPPFPRALTQHARRERGRGARLAAKRPAVAGETCGAKTTADGEQARRGACVGRGPPVVWPSSGGGAVAPPPLRAPWLFVWGPCMAEREVTPRRTRRGGVAGRRGGGRPRRRPPAASNGSSGGPTASARPAAGGAPRATSRASAPV